jgi:hypothetical protein
VSSYKLYSARSGDGLAYVTMKMKRASEIMDKRTVRATKRMSRAARFRPSMFSPALVAAGLCMVGPCTVAKADPQPQHQMNLPKPSPPNGEMVPFLPGGSSTAGSAPTLGVIGDSIARDYAYYLARELGPHGVRVVDGAVSGCPAGTLSLIQQVRGVDVVAHKGECPDLVSTKQKALVTEFHPKVVLWHSVMELRDVENGKAKIASGSKDWEGRLWAEWEDTLSRLTSNGAQVIVILPLWYEHVPPASLATPGPSVEKLRDLYTRWVSYHRDRVGLVDVAPVACPTGPPCGPVNGIDFRPDAVHFDDPGGARVAAYLKSRVSALTRLTSAGYHKVQK